MNKKHLTTCLVLIIISFITSAQEVTSYTWELNSLEEIDGHDVIVNGNPVVVDTEYGQAIEFDGVDDRILVLANPLGTEKEFTVEVIFKPNAGSNKTSEPRFIHIQDTLDPQQKRVMIELRVNDDDEMYLDGFIKTDSDDLTLVDITKTHPTEEWMHAAITFKDDTFKTFINGVKELEGILSYTDYILNETGQTSIGSRMNRKNWYSGLIKTLKFTHQEVTPENFMSIEPNTSITLNDNKKSLEYYPNPAIHEITINNLKDLFDKDLEIQIIDITGKIVYYKDFADHNIENNYRIDLTGIQDGLYFIEVNNKNNIITQKVYIKH